MNEDADVRGKDTAQSPARPPEALRSRTWVTREGIYVDRIASAWLIRRFIDPEAQFKFVSGKGYRPKQGELRFDMFEAEFTHEGDKCTFEVLLDRCGLKDSALRAIAEIIHDIDLKDGKFGRTEVAGIRTLMEGIGAATVALLSIIGSETIASLAGVNPMRIPVRMIGSAAGSSST